MSTVVRPLANFRRDLEDERTQEAERLVWEYLQRTNRWPCETHHEYPDGSTKTGWGRIEQLDIVAVVAMGKDDVQGTHRCVFAYRKAMHQLVEGAITKAKRERGSMPPNWVPFKPENEWGDYITHGWAVPLGDAFAAMVYREMVQLPGGRR